MAKAPTPRCRRCRGTVLSFENPSLCILCYAEWDEMKDRLRVIREVHRETLKAVRDFRKYAAKLTPQEDATTP